MSSLNFAFMQSARGIDIDPSHPMVIMMLLTKRKPLSRRFVVIKSEDPSATSG